MLFVPLPFIVSGLLGLLLLRTIRSREEAWREEGLFLLLVAAYAIQSVLVGLRWGYDMRGLVPIQAMLAVALPPLSWLAFQGLAGSAAAGRGVPPVAHAAGPLLAVLLLVVWPDPLDALIIALFIGYGAALLWQARQGTDGLGASRIEAALGSHRSLVATGVALVSSGAVDLAIGLDTAWSGGRHAAALVSGGNLLAILALGWAAWTAGESVVAPAAQAPGAASPADPPPARVPAEGIEDDADLAAIAKAVEALMAERHLYRDVDLNLDRLARRLGRPARAVSRAINRTTGLSVSQYVNNQRVAEACRLLAHTQEPVTRILFEAGFQTKSNFNREFQRVTGTTPSAWRRASASACAD